MSVLDTRALRTWLAEHVDGIDGEAPIDARGHQWRRLEHHDGGHRR